MTHLLNPYLTAAASGTKGGDLFVEVSPGVENIVFQTRGVPLTAFEDRLADDLMAAFEQGAVELADVVKAMNGAGSTDERGQAWTPDALETVLHTLGGQVFSVSDHQA